MHSTGKKDSAQDSDKARHDTRHLIESIDDVNNTDRLSDTCRDVVYNTNIRARAACSSSQVPPRHIRYAMWTACSKHVLLWVGLKIAFLFCKIIQKLWGPPLSIVSQARPNQPQRGSLSVSRTGKRSALGLVGSGLRDYSLHCAKPPPLINLVPRPHPAHARS